jgi:hypothetical protein
MFYTQKQIRDKLVKDLQSFYPIKWHNNKQSFYIKFRDCRLGSIRISDHPGRTRYNYTYSVFISDKDLDSRIEKIINSVKAKSRIINNFDPSKYVVFDNREFVYKTVPNEEEYREFILGRVYKNKVCKKIDYANKKLTS